MELSVFQFVPVASYSVRVYFWEESGSIFFSPSSGYLHILIRSPFPSIRSSLFPQLVVISNVRWWEGYFSEKTVRSTGWLQGKTAQSHKTACAWEASVWRQRYCQGRKKAEHGQELSPGLLWQHWQVAELSMSLRLEKGKQCQKKVFSGEKEL